MHISHSKTTNSRLFPTLRALRRSVARGVIMRCSPALGCHPRALVSESASCNQFITGSKSMNSPCQLARTMSHAISIEKLRGAGSPWAGPIRKPRDERKGRARYHILTGYSDVWSPRCAGHDKLEQVGRDRANA